MMSFIPTVYELLACFFIYFILVKYLHGTINDCLATQHYKHSSFGIILTWSRVCVNAWNTGWIKNIALGPSNSWSSVTGSEDGVVGSADTRQSGALEEVKKLENRFPRGSQVLDWI